MPVQQSDPRQLVKALREVVAVPEATLTTVASAAIAGGHLLLEDVPGVGKTLLAKALATSLGLGFRRIQFSPDVLPGDVTGVQVYLPADGSFRFVPGPVFAHVLLADEINRASARTQSGLLEAMAERQVSIDGVTHPLPIPFFVIATQNPVSFEGTYPLPEVQLDRFIAAVSLGYPSFDDELALLEGRHGHGVVIEAMAGANLLEWQQQAQQVHVDASLRAYMLGIVRASRNWPEVALGISPRGALSWQSLAKAHAVLEGRSFLVPDDLKQTAIPALAHRLVLQGEPSTTRKRRMIEEMLSREAVPR